MASPPPKPPKPVKTDSQTILQQDENIIEDSVASFGSEITLKGTKNVAELLAKDSEDESLRKYKEKLLGAAAHGDLGDVNDPRTLIVEEFRIVFAPDDLVNGQPQADIVHRLDSSEGLARLSAEGISMLEGSRFKFQISFRVQHEIIAGIKFEHTIGSARSRLLGSERDELMIGSYPPSSLPHKFEFPRGGVYNEAPKGMLLRGKYKVSNCFIDSDKVKHLAFEYELNIMKR
mmetsp:Transcript_31835/g.45824  ORF Transcript_31835/g.45824 Transcript_31835/m.45824 type:complete len:232 (+) Transcript_31835:1-696(+)